MVIEASPAAAPPPRTGVHRERHADADLFGGATAAGPSRFIDRDVLGVGGGGTPSVETLERQQPPFAPRMTEKSFRAFHQWLQSRSEAVRRLHDDPYYQFASQVAGNQVDSRIENYLETALLPRNPLAALATLKRSDHLDIASLIPPAGAAPVKGELMGGLPGAHHHQQLLSMLMGLLQNPDTASMVEEWAEREKMAANLFWIDDLTSLSMRYYSHPLRSAIRTAHALVLNHAPHLRDAQPEHFILADDEVQTLFAQLVHDQMCMNAIQNPKRAHLNRDNARVGTERNAVLRRLLGARWGAEGRLCLWEKPPHRRRTDAVLYPRSQQTGLKLPR